MITAEPPSIIGEVIHLLACNMVHNPLDLVMVEAGGAATIVVSKSEHQRRLVGAKGQNINALKSVAEWLGFNNLTLAEPSPQAEGRGNDPSFPAPGLDMTEEENIRAFFRDLTTEIFAAVGVSINLDVATDAARGVHVFCTIEASADPEDVPDAVQVAHLAKVFRAIAIRYGWEDLHFKCE